MGRNNGHGKLSKKVETFPKILIDKENDFASIKISKGIEARSYEQDGFVFCEDKSGRVIKIQVLNLSKLPELLKRSS